MYATISLCLVLTTAALSAAAPYYLAGPQQRQFFYPVVPQYTQYPAVAPSALPYRQVFYPPQAAANLVSPVPQVLRYPASSAPLVSPYTLPNKQLVFYPGPAGTYVLAGDEAESIWQSWYNTVASYFTGEKPAESAESAEKPSESAAGSAEGQKETPAKEGEKEKEGEEAKPEDAKVKGSPQNYVLVGQPQFFGNYGLQRVNPANVIPSADHGAISSYLFLKNYPGVRFAPQVPQPQIPQAADAELAPGSAALGYQKLLQQASASRQQKEFEDDSSVTVDAEADVAAKSAGAESDKPAEATDSEAKPEEEETGPTIAQVKPKAIAMAGRGGVASAAPVGTALVGPGGMAVSAPEATAVAGVKTATNSSGGAEGGKGIISKATTKIASKAVRTYQLANQNFEFLLNL